MDDCTRYVRIVKFADETGYTEKAVRRKIEDGVWLEGVHYRRAPDNAILIDMGAFNKWVEGQNQSA